MKYATIIIGAVLCAMQALAVPAKPTPVAFVQPDGTTIMVQLRGDERNHWMQTTDGYLLVEKQDAIYYGDIDNNGRIISSNILATAPEMRDATATAFLRSVDKSRVTSILEKSRAESQGIGLFPGYHFPAFGEQKGIAILVEYSDKKFTLEDPYDYFYRMLNEEGFSDHGATGSARDFYVASSMGQFLPEFDLYGPVTLPNTMAYYGGNDSNGNDKHAEQMAIHACQLLDEDVDFSQYDRDGDGKIDNVYIIYAGRGEASGGSANSVWPHSWDITSATLTEYYFDDVQLDHYACSNEWDGTKPDGIGTFVHEFGHVMGLPDLYSTSYSSAFTPGAWASMDSGCYNNDSRTPPHYAIFERYALGWIEPIIATPTTGHLSLNSISNNEGVLIPTDKDTEFFLLENRQQEGWDAYVPGHGLLIWHIDYNENVWTNNTVNNAPTHQYVDIEEADCSQTEATRSGDTFPGTAGKTEFTMSTRPALKTWKNVGIDIPITQITEDNGVISFLCGEIFEEKKTEVKSIDEVTASSFKINWEPISKATDYVVNIIGDPYYTDFHTGPRTDLRIINREPGKTYEVTVQGLKDEEQAIISDTVKVTLSEDESLINPNALSIVNRPLTSADIVNTVQYVNGEYSANDIVVIDAMPYSSNITVNTGTLIYSRDFESTDWQSWYTPFALNYDDWSVYGEMAQLNNVHQYDNDCDGVIDETVIEFQFIKKGSILPNVPYIFKPHQTGSVEFTKTDIQLLGAPDKEGNINCSSTTATYNINGIYAFKSDMHESKAYNLTGEQFAISDEEAEALQPFRIYLTVNARTDSPLAANANAPAKIAIKVEGQASGITFIESEAAADAQDEYYDLNGRRVEHPQAGQIYITKQKGKLLISE